MAIVSVRTNIRDGYLLVYPEVPFLDGETIVTKDKLKFRIRNYVASVEVPLSVDVFYNFEIYNLKDVLVWSGPALIDSAEIILADAVDISPPPVNPWSVAVNFLISRLPESSAFRSLLVDLLGEIGAGTSDHGSLTGLEDDDHPQYLTEFRADPIYWRKDELISEDAIDSAIARDSEVSSAIAAITPESIGALSIADIGDTVQWYSDNLASVSGLHTDGFVTRDTFGLWSTIPVANFQVADPDLAAIAGFSETSGTGYLFRDGINSYSLIDAEFATVTNLSDAIAGITLDSLGGITESEGDARYRLQSVAIDYTTLTNLPTLGTAASQNTSAFATAAQGTKADSALQPSAIGTTITASALGAITQSAADDRYRLQSVAISYLTLTNLPTLGTAAAQNTAAFATAAQGTLAGTALQPGTAIANISGLQTALDGKQTAFTVQAANRVYAGPTTGADSSPSFRALVAADIPAIAISGVTGLQTSLDAKGTVSSVALSAPNLFSVSGSPITGSGTLTLTLATQPANRVWAGPTTGADAAPTFRTLVAGDIPAIAISGVTGLQTALDGKQAATTVQTLGDANASINSTTTIARITSTLTAARTYTLPAANAVSDGWEIELIDTTSSVGVSGYTATLAATGSDTINGTATIVLRIPNGKIRLRSNGSNRWAIVSAPDVFHSLVTSSTTYTPPETATVIKWYGLGGGSAGGGGSTGAAGTNRSGGGAGAPGGMTYGEWAIAELLALYGTKDLVVTVGVGGTPGAAVSANSTNGNPGGAGGNTVISCGGVVIGVGLGANASTGGPSAGTQSTAILNVGSAFPMPTLANGTNVAGGSGAIANGFGAAGGGGGGGLDTANTNRSGGTGGIGGRTSKSTTGGASGTAGGGNGGNGNALTSNPYNWGDGGGGGGSNNAGNGGNGGNASGYGNGGGGGGACVNGFTAGQGGNGAQGAVLFIASRG